MMYLSLFSILLDIELKDAFLVILGFVVVFLLICCAANIPGSNKDKSSSNKSDRNSKKRDYVDEMIDYEMMGIFDDDDFD